MDFEKLSDRLKGFIQSAQTLAVREGNPQITPEHLLKVLLDDPEGLAAGLISRARGNPKQALEKTEAVLAARGSLAEAQAALMDDISPIDDIRSTAEYRRRVAANLLARFLSSR